MPKGVALSIRNRYCAPVAPVNSQDSLFPGDPSPTLPILPLRNSVLFPASVVPVNVGRARSVRLIEAVVGQGAARPLIGVVAQRNPASEDPTFDEIHHVGTVARVLKVIRLSSGNYSVVLQGVARMRLLDQDDHHAFLRARVERIRELPGTGENITTLAASLRAAARDLTSLLPNQPRDASTILDNVQEAGALADLIASNLPITNSAKQTVLETLDVQARIQGVIALVARQSEVYRVKKEISTMVREEMSRSQREYLLRQQLRSIKQQLGEPDDEDEVERLREKVANLALPIEAERAARKELRRMRTMNAASGEFNVARNYVEWITDLPWTKTSPDRLDVREARRVLDEDHHGLKKPKKRILEYIAVRKLRHNQRGPILCFVGPPGVGKTSLARSIARATGRQFVRVSLGGVSDESEIRGHRRTYVGAFPGRIISGLKKAGSRNPVILLDEIDKMGRGQRGDPASALLEVLDPEQNSTFSDHYIDLPFDLSNVLFIATANQKGTISRALLDRMEIIDLPGYTRDEKTAIASSFLVPRQLEEHGLTPERLEFEDDGVMKIVEQYTNEAGVRKLEQQVAAVCRAVAVRFAGGEDVHLQADAAFIEDVLGPPRYFPAERDMSPTAGLATGLAWTPGGGTLLFVEARQMPGSGKIRVTGQLGDVMRESAAAAFTYVRARATSFGLPDDFLTKIDIHLHFPAGAVPKDGASAGLSIVTAITSMLTRLKVDPTVASTGEITLRGSVLRIGGVKEKCLAAHRHGIKTVILPAQNKPDLEDVPTEVLKDLDIQFVTKINEALPILMGEAIRPRASGS